MHRRRAALCLFPFCLGAALAVPAQTGTSPRPASTGHTTDSASLPAWALPSPFHIVGVVLDAVTNSPLPNVVLTAVPMTTVKQDRRSRRRFQNVADSATTSSDGHFDLCVPSAGGWDLSATARNYGTQHLDEHNGYSTAVVLTDTAPQFEVKFQMTPASVIEGFVLDEAGEAVRSAYVALIYLPKPTPENQHRLPQGRGEQTTDDRGFYKFAAIAPGNYEVRITATPWYAAVAPSFGFAHISDESTLVPDSGPNPLDVVYPVLWYPGVTDPSAATPIDLRSGEVQEANFRLLPVPGSHLHITAPLGQSNGDGDTRPSSPYTFLTRVVPDGTESPLMSPSRMDGHGNADIAGLSPGTYLVHQQLPGSNSSSLSTLEIGEGSPRTVDLSDAVPAATVTVQVDPAADRDSLQISFRDLETGSTFYAQRSQNFGRQFPRRRGRPQNDPPTQLPTAPLADRTVSLPSGKYEVFLNGAGDLHLAGIDATGATATGRTITIGTGAPKLFLHIAAGLGTVTGFVNLQGKPDAGAMVLLVPATLGNLSGFDLPSRDQSNTDGSFELSGILPGGYILLAIDHGWEINWADPATLRHFLLHGVPIDIKPNSDLKQTIQAQSP
jgi:hypothetical protein